MISAVRARTGWKCGSQTFNGNRHDPVAKHDAVREMTDIFDVVIVGSGSGALVAALRAADLGLRPIVLEKEMRYGGTSAFSGGFVWIPDHGLVENRDDSREKALTYLRSVCTQADESRITAYVDTAPQMLRYLMERGVCFSPFEAYPDYFPEAPGACPGRGVMATPFDGKQLGQHFFTLRQQPNHFKLFDRYSVDPLEGGQLAARGPGWTKTFARILWRYWSDLGWRLRTAQDSRLTMGNALIGRLRRGLIQSGVDVRLGYSVDRLIQEGGRVVGVEAVHLGRRKRIISRGGVIIAAGGFEQNQEMRSRYFEFPTDTKNSASPRGGNTGAVLRAAMEIGADTDLLDEAWWSPTLVMPVQKAANVEVTNTLTFDYSRPHSLCVNRNGVRFVNEGVSYDEFGQAMRADARATSANIPCWFIFDQQFRCKFSFGEFRSSVIFPDRRVPEAWWDTYFFRAETIEQLAAKIEVPAAALSATVARMNEFAATGVDRDFGRGESAYDRFAGDPKIQPNPSLGTIDKAPFYAAAIQLGDLGTKGGLKVDQFARVLSRSNGVISGLYAIGNASASVFGNKYPGAGATLGPSMVFGYIASNHIATATQQ